MTTSGPKPSPSDWMAETSRSTEKIIGDLLEACGAAGDIVARGKTSWNEDRLLRLAVEAVISRIGDASTKLPDEVRSAMPLVPWDDIRANRILVAHVYHRIDKDVLWTTLAVDVPRLAQEVGRWMSRADKRSRRGRERDTGLGFSL